MASPESTTAYTLTVFDAADTPHVATDTVMVIIPDSTICCGFFTDGFTGNTSCDTFGNRNLSDITRLIDRVYLSHLPLWCEDNGNTNGDIQGKINLADISKLIDHVYLSMQETAACP
jgi:hypothetical protein